MVKEKRHKSTVKICCAILIIATILSLLKVESRAVEEETKKADIKLTSESTEVNLKAGERFTIDIEVNMEEDINGLVGYLDYDKDVLKVATNTSGQYNVKGNNKWIFLSYFEEADEEDDVKAGEFSLYKMTLEPTNYSLATITFEVLKDAEYTEISLNDSFVCMGNFVFEATKNANIIIGSKPAEQHTIYYNVNGGREDSITNTQTFYVGEETKITTTKPKKDGYKFIGWGLTEDATEVKYNAGDVYTENTDITLYAMWTEATNIGVELLSNTKELKAGDTIIIGISANIEDVNLTEFECILNYNKAIFEEVTENEIIGINKWKDPTYDAESGKMTVIKPTDITKSGTVCLIKMKAKEDIEINETTVSISGVEASNETEFFVAEDAEVTFNGAGTEDPEDPANKIFLETEEYKIGENSKYTEGDEYMTEIPVGTTLVEFLSNCNTNGIISVQKADGTELLPNECIETGMKIKVTKGEQKIELTLVLVGDNKPEEPVPPVEDELYLESDIYKIGENSKYVVGDKYMTKISAETKLEDFIKNCKTNGTISVLKVDNTELKAEELVGTGMTIKVTKGDKEILLTLIVVQDLNGDGKVTVSDLSSIISKLTGDTEFTEIQVMAGDIDDNKNITVTDLSSMISRLAGE